MGKDIENILTSLHKDDNSLPNVSPVEYNLKSIEFLKVNKIKNNEV